MQSQRKQSKEVIVAKNSSYNWLFGYLIEAKITVQLWEFEIRTGPFCDRESAKSTVNRLGGGGGGGLAPLQDFLFIMHLKEWPLLKWLKLKGNEHF